LDVQNSTELFYRSFAVAGPAAWNTLPSSVQELSDTEKFQTPPKNFLFSDVTAAVPRFNYSFLFKCFKKNSF